jgi:ATP-binding protein involved in chromosome partitioning
MDRIHKDFKVKALDPRVAIISERLKDIKRILVVVSGKGGVGKSLIATTLSLMLTKHGHRVGLLDLDFHGPSCHIILGAKNAMPQEERGIIPPKIHGIKFMSVVYYIGDKPLPLRGAGVSDAITELLTITQWGKLDYLVVDTPPGMGDEILDIIRLMKRSEFLIVTTPFGLALKTVSRLTHLLLELKVPILGVVENMSITKTRLVKEYAKRYGIRYLGSMPFDSSIEKSINNPEKLLKSKFACNLKKISKNL